MKRSRRWARSRSPSWERMSALPNAPVRPSSRTRASNGGVTGGVTTGVTASSARPGRRPSVTTKPSVSANCGSGNPASRHRAIMSSEHGALVDLIRRDGFGGPGAVEVGTLHFGRDQETLRLSAEQQDGSVGRAPRVEQVEMRQQLFGRCLVGYRKSPRPAGSR